MGTNPSFKDQMNSSSEVEYATADDLQKLFATSMSDLFCLALLLTAEAEEAERCIIHSMRECFASGSILRERLGPWVRHTVIRNGTRIVKDMQPASVSALQTESVSQLPAAAEPPIGSSDYSAGILELSNLDRLVYVICVLEHYTVQHCALLLGRSHAEVRVARDRALTQIGDFERRIGWRPVQVDQVAYPNSRTNNQRNEFDCSCGNLLD